MSNDSNATKVSMFSSAKERLFNGIIKENPTLVMMLGMCPTLAVTTSCINGVGMGLTSTVVLALSNVFVSLLRKVIPAKVRVPAFIVIVASFVTMVQFLLEAYLPSLNESLGIYIPLIVVNCIILGRAESYASKNPIWPSFFDGLGMGLGFTVGLGLLGAVREIIGAGQIFGIDILPDAIEPISIIGLAPGAFFVLACLVAIQNKIKLNSGKKIKEEVSCNGNCGSCASICKDKNDDKSTDEKNTKSNASEAKDKAKLLLKMDKKEAENKENNGKEIMDNEIKDNETVKEETDDKTEKEEA